MATWSTNVITSTLGCALWWSRDYLKQHRGVGHPHVRQYLSKECKMLWCGQLFFWKLLPSFFWVLANTLWRITAFILLTTLICIDIAIHKTVMHRGYYKWHYILCHPAICNPPCANGGECILPGRCSCSTEWQGRRCEIGTAIMSIPFLDELYKNYCSLHACSEVQPSML